MAKPRSELSAMLHEICDNVYFQPMTGIKLTYPCIIYERDRAEVRHADNAPYLHYDEYSIKYITRDPDDPAREKLIYLPMCSSDRMYIADNLYHFPFKIYF